MKIENKLTLSHLKENKGRTFITTLGIIVSVAMITAVFVAIASFLNLFADIAILGFGDAHAKMYVDSARVEELKNDDRIDEVGLQLEADNMNYRLSERESDRLGTGSIYVGDKTNIKQIVTGSYDGQLPENNNEIAVEQELIEDNNLDWKIGDTVTIPTGRLYCLEDNEKIDMYGCGYYDKNMFFENTATEEYKITAILDENYSTNSSYNILSCSDLNNFSADSQLVAAIKLKEVNHKSLDVINDILSDYKMEDGYHVINDDYLEANFAVAKDGFVMTTLVPMTVILLLIIICASVVLIYNAFGMSLSERVRYLGMLASVGATKRQKKSSMYFEGLILGTVGIPIGILAGIAGIGITLKSTGERIISTGMIANAGDTVDMSVVVPIWAVMGIILISALTIFISCFIPAKKASKITPIDAIRQRSEIKTKKKKIRSPKIVRLIFGYEGELAHKNLKRNGRKSRIITVSIALSIVLFLSCNYFCQLFNQAISIEDEVPYKLTVYSNTDDLNDVISQIDSIKDIDDYYCVNNQYYKSTDYENDNLSNNKYLTKTYKKLFDSSVSVYFNFIDDQHFQELCKSNNIDYQKYYSNGVKALLMNNISHNKTSSKVFEDEIIGKECGYGGYDIEISDFIDYDQNNSMCQLNPQNCISLYIPVNSYLKYVIDKEENDSFTYMTGIETEEHEYVAEKLNEISDASDLQINVVDFESQMEMMNTIVFVMEVFIYGFIALISMITIANIINTISTGISLRRKEFAMFKSIGTTPNGLFKITAFESLFYGLKSVMFALPISVLISWGLNKSVGDSTIPFEINWMLYAIVILVVFGIIGITMLYSVSKLKKETIVQTLREDIV